MKPRNDFDVSVFFTTNLYIREVWELDEPSQFAPVSVNILYQAYKDIMFRL